MEVFRYETASCGSLDDVTQIGLGIAASLMRDRCWLMTTKATVWHIDQRNVFCVRKVHSPDRHKILAGDSSAVGPIPETLNIFRYHTSFQFVIIVLNSKVTNRKF